MTESLPYPMEGSRKPYHLKPQNKDKGVSFFAFIFSVFVYFSIFYIFNLSPSTLFKTTKFWFLISNTLILIIAIDYGAFSSSSKASYDEYLAHTEPRRVTIIPSEYNNNETPVMIKDKSHVLDQQKSMHVDHVEQNDGETLLSLQIVPIKKEDRDIIQDKRIIHVNDQVIKSSRRGYYRRSKSEKAKKVAVIDEAKNSVLALRRSETNIGQKVKEEEDHIEEVNEFSNMSDDDLHKRVEEFIQRFNRQIRLQAQQDRNIN